MEKTKIIIENEDYTIQKMWIPELKEINDVIEDGKRELLEEELLETRDSRINICWTCEQLVEICEC